jgi:DNA-binding IclR family transcriptional regulator
MANQFAKDKSKSIAKSPQRGIQSIDVGGRLLQALARGSGAMTLKDLAETAGMPAAQAHTYLVSFGRMDLIEQHPTSGRYDLGAFALELGLASLNRLDAVKIASQEMVVLAERTQQSTAVAVWGNFGPTIVRFEQSVRPIHVNMRTGTVMALTETATGLVLTAHAKSSDIAAALEATHPDSKTRILAKKMLVERAALLGDVRKRGIARAQGHPVPGVSAFSAPVFDHSGNVALAITALGPTADFDSSWTSAIAAEVKLAAARVSRRLGFSS